MKDITIGSVIFCLEVSMDFEERNCLGYALTRAYKFRKVALICILILSIFSGCIQTKSHIYILNSQRGGMPGKRTFKIQKMPKLRNTAVSVLSRRPRETQRRAPRPNFMSKNLDHPCLRILPLDGIQLTFKWGRAHSQRANV